MYALLSAALASLDVPVVRGVVEAQTPGEHLLDFSRHGEHSALREWLTKRRAGHAPAPQREGTRTRGVSMKHSKDRKDEEFTEDDLAREKLGPRGVIGSGDPTVMTPAREKKTPKEGEFDGHVA